MKPGNKQGMTRIVKATRISMKGLAAAWKNEAAFRQELVLAIILLPTALLINVSIIEKLLLIITIFIVLITELLNSAVEAVVDRVGSEHHALSGQAKDIASAAVFMSLVLCGITWAIILGHWLL
ncbi:diacylglycerol kinase [uncultured Shewanella sp.]|uniref:diacylglycerol kinase n=1 Tax=uncultured Shewanella sp. TaxID=173975 RepID=UPI0026284223|nr:diacylglycerol kinase [uncultured Shewanella sp.]